LNNDKAKQKPLQTEIT